MLHVFVTKLRTSP